MGRTLLTEDKLSLDGLKDEILAEEDGAVVILNEVVRGFNRGKSVTKLELEKYEDITLQELKKVREEALLNFDVNDITIIQRYGFFDVGEDIACVIVSAAHRTAAFQACEYCMDRLKERVPIWKEEITEDDEKILIDKT
ncbi:MAG: molybdenum cofactor biosynthesis protein MoaE [Thermoplasmatota archaeon]